MPRAGDWFETGRAALHEPLFSAMDVTRSFRNVALRAILLPKSENPSS
jgi:hypothetical protein